MHDQESTSADKKDAGDSKARNGTARTPTPGRRLLSLQRSAGNQAVARMMAGRKTSAEPALEIQRKTFDEALQEQLGDNYGVDVDEMAKQFAGFLKKGAGTGSTGGSSGGSSSSSSSQGGVKGARKALDEYKQSKNNPDKREEQKLRDELDQLKSADKKAADREKNVKLLKDKGVAFDESASDEEISDMADVVKEEEGNKRKKRKNEFERERAQQKLVSDVGGRSLGGMTGGRKL